MSRSKGPEQRCVRRFTEIQGPRHEKGGPFRPEIRARPWTRRTMESKYARTSQRRDRPFTDLQPQLVAVRDGDIEIVDMRNTQT